MNLDIEGTKNEKVIIIILAYVIGFTAGFITFADTTPARQIEPAEIPTVIDLEVEPVAPETANVVPPVPAEVVESTDGLAAIAVAYTDGKLQASVGGNEYLLSIHKTDTASSGDEAFRSQGLHLALPKYLVSPDSDFVYFCEQQLPDGTCRSFIYDVAKNVINTVSFEGVKFTTTNSKAEAAEWTAAGLELDGLKSIDPKTPAILVKN